MSKIGKIKEQIEAAIEAVKDFDEPYKTKAFEVILSKSLDELYSGKGEGEGKEGEATLSGLEERIENFVKKAGVSVTQLEGVFQFNKDGLEFIYRPLQGSVADRQASFSQCILISLEEIYQKKLMEASELIRRLDAYGLDSKNLSRNLQKRPNVFRMAGRGKATKYKLTDTGKTSAMELVRTLATAARQT
jgi:hypothetical protein